MVVNSILSTSELTHDARPCMHVLRWQSGGPLTLLFTKSEMGFRFWRDLEFQFKMDLALKKSWPINIDLCMLGVQVYLARGWRRQWSCFMDIRTSTKWFCLWSAWLCWMQTKQNARRLLSIDPWVHVLFSVVGIVDSLEGTCFSIKIWNGTSKRGKWDGDN